MQHQKPNNPNNHRRPITLTTLISIRGHATLTTIEMLKTRKPIDRRATLATSEDKATLKNVVLEKP